MKLHQGYAASFFSSIHEIRQYLRQKPVDAMGMRRFTRLTNAFSKKIENLEAAIALDFMHYNYVRRHMSLRVTPAMAAGLTRKLWTIGDIVDLIV
jgi:hypothetical protein